MFMLRDKTGIGKPIISLQMIKIKYIKTKNLSC